MIPRHRWVLYSRDRRPSWLVCRQRSLLSLAWKEEKRGKRKRKRKRKEVLPSPMPLTNNIQKSLNFLPTMSLSFPFPFLFFSLESGFNPLTDPKYLESRSLSTLSDTLPMPKCAGT